MLSEKTRQVLLDELVEKIRLANGDEVQIAIAKKVYYFKSMEYLTFNEHPVKALEYNPNRHGSYHPWSGHAIGASFGESGLKEFISLHDYMHMSVAFNDVLEGVLMGAKKLAEINARAAANAANQLKNKTNEYTKVVNDTLDKRS